MTRQPTLATLQAAVVSAATLMATAHPALAAGGVTIVKQPGKAVEQVSPMTQALIQFGIGTLVILVLVFMINMILMKGMKVNPLASSRFALLGGLLLLYCLFGVLFTPIFLGAGKVVMYLCLAVLAVGSVFVLVNQRTA